MRKLTGNTSYRMKSRLFREHLLVLTVEVETEYWSHSDIDDCKNGSSVKFYEDATIHDLVKLQ